MIREVETADVGAFRPVALADRLAGDADLLSTQPVESIEQEITRLTWAVLDGSGSLGDRQRLAELVRDQHQRRRRLNA